MRAADQTWPLTIMTLFFLKLELRQYMNLKLPILKFLVHCLSSKCKIDFFLWKVFQPFSTVFNRFQPFSTVFNRFQPFSTVLLFLTGEFSLRCHLTVYFFPREAMIQVLLVYVHCSIMGTHINFALVIIHRLRRIWIASIEENAFGFVIYIGI